jgi:hypothetical protein
MDFLEPVHGAAPCNWLLPQSSQQFFIVVYGRVDARSWADSSLSSVNRPPPAVEPTQAKPRISWWVSFLLATGEAHTTQLCTPSVQKKDVILAMNLDRCSSKFIAKTILFLGRSYILSGEREWRIIFPLHWTTWHQILPNKVYIYNSKSKVANIRSC